ncbi:hypothetical protein ACIPCF_18635 (plasmid) [Paracoccus marcusii]|uniref:hypothetical protein n=1 Tax=Paracoccus marcusii TaxID=59779 RepID=UPI0038B86EEF
MVIALLSSGIIASALAGMAVWMAGYGIAMIALAYWAAGSIAIVVMIMIKMMLTHSLTCAGCPINKVEHTPRKTNS